MASSSSLGLSLPLSLILLLMVSCVHCQTCTSQTFTSNEVYSSCIDLPVLTSYLHYTYDKSNSSLSVAFVAPPAKPAGWIAWAINLVSDGMVGAQSLIAFLDSQGKAVVKTYDINSYSAVVESKLSFDVWDLAAESSGGMFRIFAKVKIPADADSVNYVWQVGPSLTGGVPDKHDFEAANLGAKATLSLAVSENGTTPSSTTATTSTTDSVASRLHRKNIHGILNAVSWGFLFPLGVVAARYLRTFESADPAWFYIHISCQVSAYAIGVAGWATGLKLGSESVGLVYSNHRNIGIALFAMATLQVFALFLRPKKDHKYRFYWNVYHHGLGYTIVVLGIFNVFKGFDILNPDKHWKSAYIIAIATLGGVALFLEAATWIVVFRRKKSDASTKPFGN